MGEHLPFYIGTEAISQLLTYCQQHAHTHFLMVADDHTYQALGARVEAELKAQGYDLIIALLKGKEIVVDERFLMQVFLQVDRKDRMFLAVGSGTITDITRFVSHRSRNSFISLPTAPSVDGFTSIGAPLVIGGIKSTYLCHSPVALFADLPTLTHAPRALIAAGLGDLLAKFFSAADFKLGHILFDEPYDDLIYQHTRQAALNCVEHIGEICSGEESGIRLLMQGLVEAGFCMLDFGNSNPASGAEHHMSHYWEMKFLREGRPAIFHGAKVAVASVLAAQWYDQLRRMSKQQASAILETAVLPVPAEIENQLRDVYGPLADQIIAEQAPYIRLSAQSFNALKERIIDRWEDIQALAGVLPPSSQLIHWLGQGGSPITGQQIGLDDSEINLGKDYGHFLRKRFTINKLRSMLRIK